MAITFTVEGRPVPQGSMTASYNRRTGTAHVHHVQGAALALWRAEVRDAARSAGATPLTVPIAIGISFGMPRPKNQMKLVRGKYVVRPDYYFAEPAVAPDIDKLVRAVLDALTGVCYDDDKQVVRVYAEKHYADRTRIHVEPVVSGLQEQTTIGLEAETPRSVAPG